MTVSFPFILGVRALQVRFRGALTPQHERGIRDKILLTGISVGAARILVKGTFLLTSAQSSQNICAERQNLSKENPS